MSSENEPKKTGCVSFVDDEVQFTDPDVQADFLTRCKALQKYAKARKKEFEELLEGKAEVSIILRVLPKKS